MRAGTTGIRPDAGTRAAAAVKAYAVKGAAPGAIEALLPLPG